MSLPSTMKALKVQEAGKAAVVDAKIPKLKDDYVLVKVNCVALNPTDWKHISFLPTPSATVGCDYTGTVVSVGSSVTKSLRPGDRVAGFCHGVNSADPEDGSFGEYAVAKGDLLAKVPEGWSDEDAATLGVGITTVGQGLCQSLGLPMPGEGGKEGGEKKAVLIYGGSTATGLFAIQWAKLANLTVITTCSPHNFDLVHSYGADAAFDYSDPSTCATSIRSYTHNALLHAFDCISEKTSPQICADSLSTAGGSGAKYSSLLPVKDFPRDDVENAATLAYTAIGEAFRFRDREVEASSRDLEYGKRIWSVAEKLMEEGKLRCPPVKVGKGGLEGILEGLEELKAGRVSGVKLVYRLDG